MTISNLDEEEMINFLIENSIEVGSLIDILPGKNLTALTLNDFFNLKSDWMELEEGRIKVRTKIAYSKDDDAFYKKLSNKWFFIQFPKLPELPKPMTEEEITVEVETLDRDLKSILLQLKAIESKALIVQDNLDDYFFDLKKYIDLRIEEVKIWTEKRLNQ